MPAEGMPWIPTPALLTTDEVSRLIRIGVELLGIARVRFTGGEPLLRPDLATIISGVARLRTRNGATPEIALTTNGLGLHRKISALTAAGLGRVNVSLDAVDPQVYRSITRHGRHAEVVRGLEAASEAGLPVKVNAVVLRNRNEGEVLPLAHFCLERGYALRFIEEMPIGPFGSWDRGDLVTADELLAVLRTHFTMTRAESRGSAPAADWLVSESSCHPAGRVGFIASVTQPFCGSCDRTRITADGQLRTCLFGEKETDLRALLRQNADDLEVAEAWRGAHLLKAVGGDIAPERSAPPTRSMSQIGG